MKQNKQYIQQQQKLGSVRAVPRLCGFYPGICLTTEEKARKNLSQMLINLLLEWALTACFALWLQ
jgi:hypothetical protein